MGVVLTRRELEETAFEFFRNGTIPARSQFGTERFRIGAHESFDPPTFRSSLAQDCDLLSLEGLWVSRYEPSPLWRIGCGDKLLALSAGGKQTRYVIDEITTTAPVVQLPAGTILYRIRLGIVPPDAVQFDPPPAHVRRRRYGRFDCAGVDVLYTCFDIETCLHEVRVGVADDITLATLEVKRPVRLADLSGFPEDVSPHESLSLLTRTICLGGPDYYRSCRHVAAALLAYGFDGFIHESYFSLVRPNAPKNVALFGRPLENKCLQLRSVNGIVLRRADYSYQIGPAPGDDPAG
jgi:hypothetical protein